jgi:polysaccharide export outer membrane protein
MNRAYILAAVLFAAAGCRTPPTTAEIAPTSPAPLPTAVPAHGVSVPAAEPGQSDQYRLGPGDVIKIAVYNEAELSGPFRISRTGTISWSWVGEVEVRGLAVEEIAERLRRILADGYMRQPRVDVGVEKYGSQVVYFLGNVSLPGPGRLGEDRTLLQNLLQAGGPKVWGDGVITVLRAGGEGEQERLTASLSGLLSGQGADNILLQDGDIVTVSSPDSREALISQDRIYVVGAVSQPGTFPWRENLTALDALMAAGGLTDYAAGNKARLVRGAGDKKEEIVVRFEDILEGQKDLNVILAPGDLIIVPEGMGIF